MALEDAKTQVDQAFTRSELRGLSFENAFGGAPSFLRSSWLSQRTNSIHQSTGGSPILFRRVLHWTSSNPYGKRTFIQPRTISKSSRYALPGVSARLCEYANPWASGRLFDRSYAPIFSQLRTHAYTSSRD